MSMSVVIFLVALAASALFSGYETGFAGANRARVRALDEDEGNLQARLLRTYFDDPARMMALLLAGRHLALAAGTIAFTLRFGPLWAVAGAMPLYLIFGEVAPKAIFRRHPTSFTVRLAPVMRLLELALAPAVLPLSRVCGRLARMKAGLREGEGMGMSTADDMRLLVDEGADHGAILEEEKAMIHSVMDLQSRVVREIMVPRIQITALPEGASRAELVATLINSGFTRIPIYRDSVDNVVGVINAFDVLRAAPPVSDSILEFVREVLHVPDTMKLDDLLAKMRETGHAMAVVTDEYGGTDGLITQEDVLEEIFGEFHDEYDKAETRIREISPGAFVVDAGLELESAAEKFGVAIEDSEVETVGGWVNHVAGRIPLVGEVIDHPPFRITVLEGRSNRLARVRVDVLAGPQSG